ncbi:GDP-mannose 4-6 dehydratase [Fragilaria crotonensis]|nr:GDP-mannose 4-6 dehydratase [Fragilaria crotonensis]
MSSERKVALVTGITGQDGSYLAEFLLEKGYTRPSRDWSKDPPLRRSLRRHQLITIISNVKPTEIYNLGAMSHVKVSFDMPEYTADCDGIGVLRMLDAIRAAGLEKSVKFYKHPPRNSALASTRPCTWVILMPSVIGHARDYVEGMWMMLQMDEPDDYVLATGETHTVREFVEKAFAVVGTTVKWVGPTGTVDEIGVDAEDESRVLIKIDPRYFRPTEVELLLGDPTKAKNIIGWVAKTPFAELVKEMVEADVAMLKGELVDTDRMRT